MNYPTINAFGMSPTKLEIPHTEEEQILAAVPEIRGGRVGQVHLDRPVRFGQNLHTDILLIYLLRECATAGISVHWAVDVAPKWDTRLMHHLPPPQRGAKTDPKIESWIDSYRHTSFFYRRGPGFYLINDSRYSKYAKRYRLRLDGQSDRFEQIQEVCNISSSNQEIHELISKIEPIGVVFRLSDWVISLPHRMLKWPVPSWSV
ncbi:DUF5825 family protein [Streptomyces virginiae]|uniref:DUF5825 family protein n=1 Tax=Streptomyces virginiae TaxID=1961 RepID=UPI00369544D0